MKQKPTSHIAQSQSIHTSSIIKLAIPQHLQYQSYSIQWRVQQQIKEKQEFGISKIFKRENNFNLNNQGQYQCTPLDYGKIIIGSIVIRQDNLNKVILQSKFGPVEKQKQLQICQISAQRQVVKLELNKNRVIFGTIKIASCPFVINNNYKLDILLVAQNFQFSVRIQADIKIPNKVSFFKFYPKQDNCLGLSIYHQHKQFIQKLKQLKIQTQFGYYIKVYFQNRKCRDAFLFQLMEYFGIINSQIKLIDCQQPFQINIIPQKSIQNSSVSAETKRNEKEGKKKDIDEEIYNLLYQNEQAIQEQRRISFAMSDAQYLFSQMRKSDIMKKSDLKNGDDSLIKFQTEVQIRKNNQKLSPQDIKNKTQKVEKIEPLKKQIANIQFSKNNYVWSRNNSGNTLRKSDKQLQLRTTITQLTNQIDNLFKQNRKLSKQNKKLKDQNMRLRLRDVKGQLDKSISQKNDHSLHKISKLSVLSPKQSSINSIGNSNKVLKTGKNLVQFFNSKKQTSISKLLQTSVTQKGNRTTTLQSPNSGEFSQQLAQTNRKNEIQNFTSFSNMANHLFVKDQPTVCSKSSSKYNLYVSKNKSKNSKNRVMVLSSVTKNIKNAHDMSFDKEEVPCTPSFNEQPQNIEMQHNFGFKTYQSCFFRQYMKE